MTSAPILLIEDTPTLQLVYETVLTRAGHTVRSAASGAAGLAAFRTLNPPVVLLDLMLPDQDGLDVMRAILADAPGTPVIVITANASIAKAVEAMRNGAHEFLVKPFNEQRLITAVENALRSSDSGRNALPTTGERKLPGFIGTSDAMRHVYTKIRSVSRSMAPVFITGESGTGKELCAQAVHDASARSMGPFIALNCGAIPSDLLESEVFGHLKGSFTGAIADKPGAAAAADGGTLFLDEICEMDLNLQTKLLRFLQTSTIQPVGATRTRKVDVRIICATNRDPRREVQRGAFREDLYYRLHVIPIHMPPLRERGDDMIEIAAEMLHRFAAEEGARFTGLDDDVADLFRNHPWPGNVRQLLNVLRNVVVLHDGPLVRTAMLPDDLHMDGNHGGLNAPSLTTPRAPDSARPATHQDAAAALVGLTLAAAERMLIEATLARHEGSVPRAARVLDVSPSTLYRKMATWESQSRSAD
jgi:DNA-binding NtrC family response regulator